MQKIIFFPPLAFMIILAVTLALVYLSARLAYRSKKPASNGAKSYACGEDNYDHLAQPDYSVFFPFAFFFTLAHVATLIIATVPMETLKTFDMAVLYIIGTVVGLSILLRK
jgi:NADH:ubiquinone oxidoreductase subunit 3 (subunit A)